MDDRIEDPRHLPVPLVITDRDRRAFGRCRRQWDLGSPLRQDLEPLAPAAPPGPAALLDVALRDALAVYYFPGMWDWDRAFVVARTIQGFQTAATRSGLPADVAGLGGAVLERYLAWAPAVDRFTPIRVAPDLEVLMGDPRQPGLGLADAFGRPLHYVTRLDLLVTDAADRYWTMRHRIAEGEWTPDEVLRLDQRDLAGCWAWQESYPGLQVSGTITNEILLPADPFPTSTAAGKVTSVVSPSARPVHLPQNAPSGGGRSVGTLQRVLASAGAVPADPWVRDLGEGTRRTWIARTQAEIGEAGRTLSLAALDMVDPDVRIHPRPSVRSCPACAFRDPCLTMALGQDPGPILAAAYRRRPPPVVERGRLGGASWGIGRGAAPPLDPTGTNPPRGPA